MSEYLDYDGLSYYHNKIKNYIDTHSSGDSSQWFTGTVITGHGSYSVIISGTNIGDMYLNTNTGEVYKQTNTNYWVYQCTIKGQDGTDGTDGENGTKWFLGNGLTGTGSSISYTVADSNIGDFYLNTDDSDLNNKGNIYKQTGESIWAYQDVLPYKNKIIAGTEVTGTSTSASHQTTNDAWKGDMYFNTDTKSFYTSNTDTDYWIYQGKLTPNASLIGHTHNYWGDGEGRVLPPHTTVYNDSSTAKWYKVASISTDVINSDLNGIFVVTDNFYSSNVTDRHCIIKVRGRVTTPVGEFGDSSNVNYVVRTSSFDANRIAVRYINHTNEDGETESGTATVELWIKIDLQYDSYTFAILSEGSRFGEKQGNIVKSWKLYSTSDTGYTSLPHSSSEPNFSPRYCTDLTIGNPTAAVSASAESFTSGTKIGSVTVNGTPTNLYTPSVSVSQTQSSLYGTEIASVSVGGTPTKIYAPTISKYSNTSDGKYIGSVTVAGSTTYLYNGINVTSVTYSNVSSWSWTMFTGSSNRRYYHTESTSGFTTIIAATITSSPGLGGWVPTITISGGTKLQINLAATGSLSGTPSLSSSTKITVQIVGW